MFGERLDDVRVKVRHQQLRWLLEISETFAGPRHGETRRRHIEENFVLLSIPLYSAPDTGLFQKSPILSNSFRSHADRARVVWPREFRRHTIQRLVQQEHLHQLLKFRSMVPPLLQQFRTRRMFMRTTTRRKQHSGKQCDASRENGLIHATGCLPCEGRDFTPPAHLAAAPQCPRPSSSMNT